MIVPVFETGTAHYFSLMGVGELFIKLKHKQWIHLRPSLLGHSKMSISWWILSVFVGFLCSFYLIIYCISYELKNLFQMVSITVVYFLGGILSWREIWFKSCWENTFSDFSHARQKLPLIHLGTEDIMIIWTCIVQNLCYLPKSSLNIVEICCSQWLCWLDCS